MACSLPQFIFLKSNKNDKYLRHRKENDATHACLEFSGDAKQENVEIQYVKFEVQKSETLEGFVHIRSSYNNKYWVRKCGGEEEKKKWIAVEANEAEEDPSKLSCTLFKPVGVGEQDGEQQDKGQKIRLVHIDQEGQQGCVAPADSDLLTLAGGLVGDDDGDVFIAYNAASAFILPEYVALTNHEGKYDGGYVQDGRQYVDFNTTDIGRCMVMQPVQYPLANPPYIDFRYHSPINARWGIMHSMLVWNQPIGTNLTANFDVTPIPLGGNQIALRSTVDLTSYGNPNVFLNRVPNQGAATVNILGLYAASIVADARFGVVEPVLRREISQVRYAVEDSRVYNVGSLDKYTDERSNNTSVEQTGSFSVSYTNSRSTTWGDSVSLTTGVTASISASIPYVGVSLGVELSEERTQTVEFGKEVSSEETVAYVQNLTIPPRKKLTLSVIATWALCDVPFTCQVIDTLTNGTVRRYTKLDGLFTGANEFGFQTIVTEGAI